MPILVLLVSTARESSQLLRELSPPLHIAGDRSSVFSALISTTLSLVLKIDVGISDIIKTETLMCFSRFPLG
jgi:hypothetical protein